MFIHNKYYMWYYNIINHARQHLRTGYTENHHIVPKSLGGSNKKENLVLLSAREHYVIHLLLTKCTTGVAKKKMFYAMNRIINRDNEVLVKSSRIYEYIRTNHAKVVSEFFKNKEDCGFKKSQGKTHEEIFGKARSAEIKDIIRKANSERIWSDETRRKMSEARLGKPNLKLQGVAKSKEHKQNLSISKKIMHRTAAIERTWSHKEHGTHHCTQYDIIDMFPELKASEFGKVINTKYPEKSYKGWSIVY